MPQNGITPQNPDLDDDDLYVVGDQDGQVDYLAEADTAELGDLDDVLRDGWPSINSDQ
ncbi:hypothetical protein ABIA32_003244 [Streptacidiphilus sp. MAP12-20]|uniref:hypothetical protein n=1 Tax=Streptacidiphilus sp. MAP12-20 TaxID=3156299 RepID=UPI003518D9F8